MPQQTLEHLIFQSPSFFVNYFFLGGLRRSRSHGVAVIVQSWFPWERRACDLQAVPHPSFGPSRSTRSRGLRMPEGDRSELKPAIVRSRSTGKSVSTEQQVSLHSRNGHDSCLRTIHSWHVPGCSFPRGDSLRGGIPSSTNPPRSVDPRQLNAERLSASEGRGECRLVGKLTRARYADGKFHFSSHKTVRWSLDPRMP